MLLSYGKFLRTAKSTKSISDQLEKKANAHSIETISKKHLLVNIDIDKPRIYIGPSRFMVYVNLAHDSKADVFGEGHISDILFQYF